MDFDEEMIARWSSKLSLDGTESFVWELITPPLGLIGNGFDPNPKYPARKATNNPIRPTKLVIVAIFKISFFNEIPIRRAPR